MNIEIKQADLSNIDTLIEWRMEVLHEVFSIPNEQNTDDLRNANFNYYNTVLNNGRHISCFALSNNKIVGCGDMCLYSEMPSPDNPTGQCAYLMNIYTRAEFRKQGIGGKIVSWLIKKAKNKGITKIYLETSENGRSMYEKLGFLPMVGYMILKNTNK